MLMVMAVAFGGAGVAGAGAKFEHFAQHPFVGATPAQAQRGRRLAHIGAIEADADALGHVHFLGRTGVRARQAHLRAIHGVVNGIAERLEKFPIRLTQLAHGLPVGGELDYLDEGTLAQALRARRQIA